MQWPWETRRLPLNNLRITPSIRFRLNRRRTNLHAVESVATADVCITSGAVPRCVLWHCMSPLIPTSSALNRRGSQN